MRRVRIFSLRRAALSVLLGFLIPLGYAFLLSEAFDYARRPTPQFLVWMFGWPRPLWIFLMGRQPTESDIVGGLIFVAACNIVLYGMMVYSVLTMLAVARGQRWRAAIGKLRLVHRKLQNE